jgi:hypothetical protein
MGGEGVGHRLDNIKLFAVRCKAFAKLNLYERKKMFHRFFDVIFKKYLA